MQQKIYKIIKVDFATKLLSNHKYLSEIPVEGKVTGKFFKKIGYNEHYVGQVIRNGNCITLLDMVIPLTVKVFWNTHYFEDLAKFVFWTFNKSFMLKLTEELESLKLSEVQRCLELLKENFTPYPGLLPPEDADQELKWCYVKNWHLKQDPMFNQMYLLDEQNRTAIMAALEKKIGTLMEAHPAAIVEEPIDNQNETTTIRKTIPFLSVLRPTNNSSEETLQFIQQKVAEAGFEYNIFSPVPRLENGKNPYGLNGCMAAMIDHFYQLNYFKKEYSLEEIFKAYLQYSGNSIGKLKTFISEFRQDKSFMKYTMKLNKLKIVKLS